MVQDHRFSFIHSFIYELEYLKGLNRFNFPDGRAGDLEFEIERYRRGKNAGFTEKQCDQHLLIDFALAVGLDREAIRNLGLCPGSGYIVCFSYFYYFSHA